MNKFVLALTLLMVAPVAADEGPRWGSITYDLEVVEYNIPKCSHSKVKKLVVKQLVKRIVIRIECAPVQGEVNRPNPDLYRKPAPKKKVNT